MGIIPDRIRASKLWAVWLRLTRVLQSLSSAISLAFFSARIYKVIRISHKLPGTSGAVEGILGAAVIYTILATLLQCTLRGGGPKFLRWLLVIFDLLFVGAFITVAVITSPGRTISGPCPKAQRNNPKYRNTRCNLPWGTFILAIVSTVLHMITAVFHEVRDHHKKTNVDKHMNEKGYKGSKYGSNDSEIPTHSGHSGSNGLNNGAGQVNGPGQTHGAAYQNGAGYPNGAGYLNGAGHGNNAGLADGAGRREGNGGTNGMSHNNTPSNSNAVGYSDGAGHRDTFNMGNESAHGYNQQGGTARNTGYGHNDAVGHNNGATLNGDGARNSTPVYSGDTAHRGLYYEQGLEGYQAPAGPPPGRY